MYFSPISLLIFVFFFNDTATTEIYTLSLHDALPIYLSLGMIYLLGNPLLREPLRKEHLKKRLLGHFGSAPGQIFAYRSEEHTSELQSQSNLVCRLLLEKKKKH